MSKLVYWRKFVLPLKPKSILARIGAWKSAKGTVLVALLTLPFGLYEAAANFPEQATIGMLIVFALFMLFVLLER
jgi:hypothetical protein